ncbi:MULTISPECIES: pentapeptide repeat-containing protein [unclassified Aureispira]|uniref:pentapeptide repeat-containing protein n=1 Tax=unclassified Aureispira TaxID=2649989 RepID=UPI0006970400|nr:MULTISPECIES: pentapeptide repeat-containing protein [unclassified Aureispira]WMX17248.1 pentapeptide repeat-containing protein [Aureispira sp. CCB-E]
MEREYIEGFYQSEIPPRDSDMDAVLIRNMASSATPFTSEEVQKMLEAHDQFIQSGGSGGRFERLQLSGIPMNIYMGKKGTEGKQFEVRMKQFSPETSLENVQLTYSDFAGAIAEEVNFQGANLNHSLLTDAFLAGANFDNCSAVGTDFTGADLTGASFVNADLRNADFEICNCTGVDFTGANLEGALFKGTTLDGIRR